MRVYHRPDIDYVSIDFKNEIEAKSAYEGGIIVRYDKKGNVIGLDITDSTKFFLSQKSVSFKEACQILEVSDSTLRRLVKSKKLKATKSKNGRDYHFKKADLVKYKMGN